MNKTVFRPSISGRIHMLLWVGIASLWIFATYRGSWVLDYSGQSISDYVIEERFEPSAVDIGLFIFGLTLLILAIEVLGRSVEIDEKSVRSHSPLRLYRQSLACKSVEDARLTPLIRWGRVLELQVDGKWIVFMGNERFKDRVHFYFPKPNSSKPTKESV